MSWRPAYLANSSKTLSQNKISETQKTRNKCHRNIYFLFHQHRMTSSFLSSSFIYCTSATQIYNICNFYILHPSISFFLILLKTILNPSFSYLLVAHRKVTEFCMVLLCFLPLPFAFTCYVRLSRNFNQVILSSVNSFISSHPIYTV